MEVQSLIPIPHRMIAVKCAECCKQVVTTLKVKGKTWSRAKHFVVPPPQVQHSLDCISPPPLHFILCSRMSPLHLKDPVAMHQQNDFIRVNKRLQSHKRCRGESNLINFVIC